MNIKASLLLLITLFCANTIYAQEDELEQSDEKHIITLALGYTHIPKGGEEGESEANGESWHI